MTAADHDRGSRADTTDGPRPDRLQLLAHDIRSAVSDVIGGVRLMDRESLPPEALVQLDRVQSASELLARLVEELVDGTPRDTVGPVGNLNLRRFLDDEVRRWHGVARGTGTKVSLDRAANVPDIVKLDRLHLRRIVSNLMSNALRHAEGARIALGAELYSDGTLSLCITDTGAGFPPDLLPQVFAPATRAETGTPGTGMGLHIAKAHADAIGGSLAAENRPTGGARVTLTIPRGIWKPLDGPEGIELPDLAGMRVLVADDSATNRTLLVAMLTRMGAECEVARDGIEALNWMARERFDLALVDIEMPTLGGLDVLRSEKLRQARGIAPPTSMVAMTAYVLRDNREAIYQAGADGILAKPIGKIEAFGKAVSHFRETAPDASGWAPELAPALSAVMLADLMAAAGPEFDALLLARMREDLERVETELTMGLADADMAQISAQTHILLSLSSAIGALPTQEAARRLNRLKQDVDFAAVRIAGKVCLARLAHLREELAKAR